MSQEGVKLDLSVCTKFLRFLMIPRLIDHLLKKLFEENPTCPSEAVKIMMKSLTTVKESYFKLVSKETKQKMQQLMTKGFINWNGGDLRFCVPLEKGTVFELFPYGTQIEVNPNNCESFISLYSTYLNVCESCTEPTVQRIYAKHALPLLPISAQSNLLCANYNAILLLVKEHLLNSDSIWFIASREIWDKLNVTYALPFKSRLFPVVSSKECVDPVPFSEAPTYVELATQKQHQLLYLSTLGIPLNDKARNQPLDHPGPSTSNIYTRPNNSKSFYSIQVGSQPLNPGKVSKIFASESSLSKEEQCFWKWVYHLRAKPESAVPGKIAFVLKLPYGLLTLKENGEYISVTPNNIQEFVNLVESMSDKIHELFRKPLPSSGDLEISANIDTSYRYPVADSKEWNQFILTHNNIDEAFFDQVRALRERFENKDVTMEELKEYRFYIATNMGIYDLIPGGRYISVNYQNADEYFMRIEQEYYKLHDRGLSVGSLSKDVTSQIYQAKSRYYGDGSQRGLDVDLVKKSSSEIYSSCKPAACTAGLLPALSKQRESVDTEDCSHIVVNYQHLIPAEFTSKVLGISEDRNETNNSRVASSDEFLDERDLLFLSQLERHISALLSKDVSGELKEAVAFKWCIFVPNKHLRIRLKPNGDSIPVAKDEFDQYLRVVISKIHQIRREIIDYGCYPKFQ